MLIINADDWGRSKQETDLALACHAVGRVTSVSAMVYMDDSQRAADLANESNMDVGLHINFTQAFTGAVPTKLAESHDKVARFLKRDKYAHLFYHPLLRNAFRYVYEAQAAEFFRIYGRPPSHFDGHQHMHHCSNMLLDRTIPRGQRVRGPFSFKRGEKGGVNRAYRAFVKWWMAREYVITDYFFALSQCLRFRRLDRALELARICDVELMTHPADQAEYAYLMGREFQSLLGTLKTGSYRQMQCAQQP